MYQLNPEHSNGLGDRLLDCIGGYVLSEIHNVHFEYIWSDKPATKNNGVLYDKKLFDLKYCKPSKYLTTKNIKSPNPSFSLSPTVIMKNNQIDIRKLSNLFTKSAAMIRINANVDEFLYKHLPSDMNETHGIHLRHTDKIEHDNRKVSPIKNNLQEYREIMTNLKMYITNLFKTNDILSFFVCSDNPQVKDGFIHWLNLKSKEYNTSVRIIKAPTHESKDVIDLFTLSKCKSILSGTKYSTFSILACLLSRNKMFGFFGKNIQESLLQIGHVF